MNNEVLHFIVHLAPFYLCTCVKLLEKFPVAQTTSVEHCKITSAECYVSRNQEIISLQEALTKQVA